MTAIVAAIRIVHTAAVTLLGASCGFLAAAVVARNTPGFETWADGLAATYFWNFALAFALLALQAVLHVGQGVVHLIVRLRAKKGVS